MAQWFIKGRFIFDGGAFVEADTPEDARKKFDDGDFEFYEAGASCCDWESRGKPEAAV